MNLDINKRCSNAWRSLMFQNFGYLPLSMILVFAEFFLCSNIIHNIPYTEIDWIAYMQEVEKFLNGTLDYDQIEGQTGPLVYPAGFTYVYSLFYWLTDGGVHLRLAQYIFMGLYLMTLAFVFNIYRLSCKTPPYVLVFMCVVSYRVHSLYLLRLFNDCITMLILYASINAFLYDRFTLGSILFSVGLSVKMNILLFLPGLIILLIWHKGILETVGHLCEVFIIQLLFGAPFLFHNAFAYLNRAFNFGRQFTYQWTVNWRLIPEWLFLDRKFHLILLITHLILLLIFAWKFIRSRGGLGKFLSITDPKHNSNVDSVAVIYPLFITNFIGIICSRSLHYQFYVWYFHTLPYLLWSVEKFPSPFRLLILGLIEICWNTYPSTILSSGLLHICHWILLIGLFMSPVPCIASVLAFNSKKVETQFKKQNTEISSKRRRQCKLKHT